MPRNIRNFWLSLWVEGRKQVIRAGPRSKDGGFALAIQYREKGSICDTTLHIDGECRNGRLTITTDGPPFSGALTLLDVER